MSGVRCRFAEMPRAPLRLWFSCVGADRVPVPRSRGFNTSYPTPLRGCEYRSRAARRANEKLDIKSRDLAESIGQRITRFFQKRDVRISHDAVSFLIEAIGSDTGRMVTELEKLHCYIIPRDIVTLDDCKSICSRTPETAAWAFADAIASRDITSAFEAINPLIDQLRQQKSSNALLSILGTAMRRFQEMINLKKDGRRLSLRPGCPYPQFRASVEAPPPDLKEELRGSILLKSHPYRAWKLLNESANFDDQELAGALSALLKTNRQLVSGGASPRIALEQLVMRICPRKEDAETR